MKKQMFAGANRLFAAEAGKPSAREAKLTMDLVRARHVIAEITAENLKLKKNALELEDHGKLPMELHQEVHRIVGETKSRSGWSVRKILFGLCVPRTSYYRWLRGSRESGVLPMKPVQPYEALPEERKAVREYALKHPEIRHRELSWKMVDEGEVCLSGSTV